MHPTFTRLTPALLASAMFAVSAATAGPALAAPVVPKADTAVATTPAIPSVQDPDVAVQLALLAPCPTPEQLKALTDELSQGRRDVRASCPDGRVRIGIYSGGIPKSPELSLARDKGLARVSVAAGLQSGIRVHPRVTRQLESQTGTALLRKRTSSLRFSVFGPDRPRVRFVAPNTVVTTIRGKDTRPFPDVSFTTTITDTFTVQDGRPNCTTRVVTKAKTGIQKGLFALALLTAPANGGILAAGFGAQLALIENGIRAQNRKPADEGPGCSLLRQVLVPGFPLADGSRLVFNYAKASVENGGIVARFFASRPAGG